MFDASHGGFRGPRRDLPSHISSASSIAGLVGLFHRVCMQWESLGMGMSIEQWKRFPSSIMKEVASSLWAYTHNMTLLYTLSGRTGRNVLFKSV